MRNLLRFLLRYYPIILFLFYEILAIIFVSRSSSFHSAKIYKVKHNILGRIDRKFDNLSTYFSLVKENKKLAEEKCQAL
jgi:hypothetical protein